MEQKKYYNLSKELEKRIMEDRKSGYLNPYRTKDEDAVRRKQSWDRNKLLRPAFVRYGFRYPLFLSSIILFSSSFDKL